ncbi:MAG: hypothetical protein GY754_19470 [bacterium]|nr:hypothetical protein [bacterium]
MGRSTVMGVLRKIIEGQVFQILFAAAGLYVLQKLIYPQYSIDPRWFSFAVCIPLIHQLWVSFFWRLQLYTEIFKPHTRRWFSFYKAGFILFALLRIFSIFMTGYLERGSMPVSLIMQIVLCVPIGLVSIYGMYSVVRYFSIERAFGLDHFDEAVRETGLVKKGIFNYTQNGMYAYVLLFIYLFPILLESQAALYIAVYNHMILWIHYFCTEKPDMNKIYGS